MRFLFFAALLLFVNATTLVAQDLEPSTVLTVNPDNSYSYEKVFDMPGKSKDEIFESLKAWIIKNIKSQSNTNYFDEKEKNSVSTTPAFTVSGNSTIEFKLNIDVKEGKYRLVATSFIYHNMEGIAKNFGDYSGLYGAGKKYKKKVVSDVDDFFSKMLVSIQGSIGKKADW